MMVRLLNVNIVLPACRLLYSQTRYASNFKRSPLMQLPRENSVIDFKNRIYQDDNLLSSSEWRKLREELMQKVKQVNKRNIDSVILSQCKNPEDLVIAKRYIEFLEGEGIQPNTATLGKLLKIYHAAYAANKISSDDVDSILKIYNNIRQGSDVYDSTTCENLIYGILATNKWRDSLDLLRMAKLSASPSSSVYSAIIAKALQTNDMLLGWELWTEMVEAQKQPKCETYISYIQSIAANPKTFPHKLEDLFSFLGQHELIISQSVVGTLKATLKALGHSIHDASLNTTGKCSNCQKFMQNISISDEDFNALSSAFLDRVLILKDVFLKSSPGEVDNFVNFVSKTGPYDCVIDGLNVAYSLGSKKSTKVFAHLVTSTVNHFRRQNKHILVIGRQHMNQWPKHSMNFIRKNACLFLTNDLSHDDPFLLYATLKSGQTTDFFSRDLMSSHAFLLGPKLKPIFRRWQQEHQYSLITSTDFGKFIVKEPIRHVKYSQKVDSTWHIPFKENYSANPAESFDVPDSWLCIKFK